MNEEHFNFLLNAEHVAQGNVGHNALVFGNMVQDIVNLPNILDQIFNRNTLLEICNNANYCNLTLTVAILAWGKMRNNHAINLFHNWHNLDPIINDLRFGHIQTRGESFEVFVHHRANGNLPGLGIAYFTKLISFLNPNLNGYILDQWTAKSINLLWNERLVQIENNCWVNVNNTPQIYEEFCQRIEHLADNLAVTPFEAEERIFSVGGVNPGPWREYLRHHYL